MRRNHWVAVGLLVFALAAPVRAQVRVSPNSHLENVEGDSISYERFVELARSDRYRPEPIRNDVGEVVGYRLAPAERSDTASSPRKLTGPVRGLDRAVRAPMEVAGGRLLVPATVHGPRGSKEVLFMFDTGTFAPVLLLPGLREAVGTSDGRLDSLTVGGVTVDRPVTGRHASPGTLHELIEEGRERADRFTELPVGGVLGGPVFHRAIVSLDAQRERLVVRPVDSHRRTLYDREPVAAAEYRAEMYNVWIPVTVDDTEGYAHLDTGYSYTWVAKDAVSGRPSSFRVGGRDLLPHMSDAELRVEAQGERYESFSLDVIANIGVDALGELIVTVDGDRDRVYFERSGGEK